MLSGSGLSESSCAKRLIISLLNILIPEVGSATRFPVVSLIMTVIRREPIIRAEISFFTWRKREPITISAFSLIAVSSISSIYSGIC